MCAFAVASQMVLCFFVVAMLENDASSDSVLALGGNIGDNVQVPKGKNPGK